jgi:dethiobiotin synthetase
VAKGFFVTGTDTGVGKTIITAALIKAAHILGFKACGMKPIETGCKREEFKVQSSKFKVKDMLIPSDGTFLREITGTGESIDLITPIRFENPLAPLPASEIEDKPIDLDKIKTAYKELSNRYDVIIVEGIGGLLVPIKKGHFVIDLAKDFGLPIIVVSKPGLGAINHTMLTVNYAINKRLDVAGIIINYTRTSEGTLAENTNPEIIRRLSPVPVIGIFPYLKDLESRTIGNEAVKNLDIEFIRTFLPS